MSELKAEHLTSWHARLFTSWVRPLLRLGATRPIGSQDLFPLNPEETAQRCAPLLERALHENRGRKSPVVSALIANHKGIFWFSLMLAFAHLVTNLAAPFLLRMLLTLLADPLAAPREGMALAGAIIAASYVSWLMIHHCFLSSVKLSLRIRSGLVSAVYRKSLALTPAAQKDTSLGTIVNMMSKDVENVFVAGQNMIVFIMASVEVVAAIALIYAILGPSSLAGIAVLLLSIPISNRIADRMKGTAGALAQLSDKRVGLMSDLLRGIRVVKFYAWEKSFARRIDGVREQELVQLRRFSWQSATLNLVFLCSPILVAVVTFSVHVLLGGRLRVADVFPVLAIFGILRPPLLHLPNLVSSFMGGRVSVVRLDAFLALPEIPKAVACALPPGSVRMAKAAFCWSAKEPVLRGLDLEIRPGELVAVVGRPGAGKSSLLSAIIGDLARVAGESVVCGKLAYVPQQAFLLNATVRDNILFGAPFDEERYARVLEASCLEEDLAALPAGDLTEIGERAVNLSGGQKQRLSIARAAYAAADIVLLDDPFSALDNIVGRHVLRRCLLDVMQGTTRVLVTHRLDYATTADRVFLVEDGVIVESGTVAALTVGGGRFQKMLADYQRGYDTSAPGASPATSDSVAPRAGVEPRGRPAIDLRAPATDPVIASEPTSELAGRTIEVEERAVGAVKREVYLGYVKMLGGAPTILGVLGIFLVRECLSVGSDLWLALFSQNRGAGVTFLLGLGVLGALAAGATFARAITVSLRGVHAARILHTKMLRGVMRAPLSFFEATPIGRVLNRFSKDLRAIDEQVIFRYLDTTSTAFLLLSSALVITIATPLALIAIVPVAWLYLRLQRYVRPSLREVNRVESIAHSPLYAHFSETLSGLSSIRAYRTEARFQDECLRRLEQSQRAVFTQNAVDQWMSLRLDTAGVAVVGVAALLAVASRRSVEPEIAALSITYAMMLTGVLARAVRSSAALEIGMNSVERAEQYAQLVPEQWEGRGEEPSVDWPQAGRIAIQGLEMRYKKGLELTLRGISCVIAPGQKIGIVGRTGSGKSTLLLCLFRMVEVERGSIVIDGVDIAGLSLEVLRSHITIIPQDPVLFQGTIRSNLDPEGSATDEELWAALRRGHLEAVITRLPDGLMTDVGDGEATLSAGQRQLLCLARALLRNTRILLLDEATASVDHETDGLVQSTVRQDFAHCTVLTIAHRVHTVVDYDRVMVLDHGKLVEFDAPGALLARTTSVFRHMAREESAPTT